MDKLTSHIVYIIKRPWTLKIWIGEEADYDKIIARYRAEGLGNSWWSQDMRIVPVNFNKEHKVTRRRWWSYCN